MSTIEFSDVIPKLGKMISFNLEEYQQEHLKRRVHNFMSKTRLQDYNDFLEYLSVSKEHIHDFKNVLTVNVSEFFRNPDRFDDLEKKVFKTLAEKSASGIRAWSAGCSIGAEVYSFAMILDKLHVLEKSYLLATDIDREIIDEAKRGVYKDNLLINIDDGMKYKYFDTAPSPNSSENIKEKFFQIKRKIVNQVQFRQHDLLKDTFFQDMDLIACRNVVIYFKEEAKFQLYNRFHASLKTGGYLFVGGTESLPYSLSNLFKLVAPHIYQKI